MDRAERKARAKGERRNWSEEKIQDRAQLRRNIRGGVVDIAKAGLTFGLVFLKDSITDAISSAIKSSRK